MTKAYVLVEGPPAAELLRRLLGAEATNDVQFVIAGSHPHLPSLARSLLVRRRKPVAVVMDAESVAPEVIQERRENTEELLRLAAGAVPMKVVVAVPALEASFFAAPALLERLFQKKVPPELVVLGRRDPVGVLQELAARTGRPWDTTKALQALDARDIEQMRAEPAVRELSGFLQGLPGDHQAA
jgi:hypothetical protein